MHIRLYINELEEYNYSGIIFYLPNKKVKDKFFQKCKDECFGKSWRMVDYYDCNFWCIDNEDVDYLDPKYNCGCDDDDCSMLFDGYSDSEDCCDERCVEHSTIVTLFYDENIDKLYYIIPHNMAVATDKEVIRNG